LFASLPSAPVVRTSTPFTFEASELTVICPLPGGAAAVGPPIVAKYAQLRTSRLKIA
jgi:hypothetical protein